MAGPDLRTPDAIARAVDEAAGHYRQGRLDEAEKICTPRAQGGAGLVRRAASRRPGQARNRQGGGRAGAARAGAEAQSRLGAGAVQSRTHALGAQPRRGGAGDRSTRRSRLRPAVSRRSTTAATCCSSSTAPATRSRRSSGCWRSSRAFLGARINLGNALAQLGRFDEALAQYDALLAVQPSHAETHLNRGSALAGLGRAEEAIAAFDRALALRAGLCQGADRARRRARGAQPASGGARGVRTRARARQEQRRRPAQRGPRRCSRSATIAAASRNTRRAGSAPACRAGAVSASRCGSANIRSRARPFWLHAEQGLGDTIQFVRYAPHAGAQRRHGGAGSAAGADGAAVARRRRGRGGRRAARRCPPSTCIARLGSLPRALRTELVTIPADRAVSRGERRAHRPVARAHRGAAVAAHRDGLVGQRRSRQRPQPLDPAGTLGAAVRAGRRSFISIQRELRAADAAALARTPNAHARRRRARDFDDTAAVVALADLVISVDTSVVHLAGALGRPIWVLLPFCPDWRWLLERDDSPWYPTVRLFRQPAPGDWDSVIARRAGAAVGTSSRHERCGNSNGLLAVAALAVPLSLLISLHRTASTGAGLDSRAPRPTRQVVRAQLAGFVNRGQHTLAGSPTAAAARADPLSRADRRAVRPTGCGVRALHPNRSRL